jgi:hypothetical protein
MTHQLRHAVCRSLGILALASILVVSTAVPAPADDEPGPDDLARITEALKRAGFHSFEGVEFDDGVWEVDDAVGSDGREYDLELDPQTLKIVRREAD